MVAMSAAGRVGLHSIGFVVTGGSRKTGSASGADWLVLCVCDTRGAGGADTDGGTM